jgi:predicted AlkP superfamily pyrophosphatase or phosphodiesterase
MLGKKSLCILVLSLVCGSFVLSCQPGRGSARRVLLIGIDGVTIDGFEKAPMPVIKGLMQRGAWSKQARSVMPTVSAPNWASILNGAGPEQHGVTSNSWTVTQRSIEPTESDNDGYFPDIFYLVHEKGRGAASAIYYDWPELINLFNLYYFKDYEPTKSGCESVEKALPFLLKEGGKLTFVYFGAPDETAHTYGFESSEYLVSLAQIDSCVGVVTSALEKQGMLASTHILVVSDHGGIGKSHGGLTMTELLVPWIVAGPEVRVNHEISMPVNVFDTAPTIAYLLGIKAPDCWIGRPVKEAFGR